MPTRMLTVGITYRDIIMTGVPAMPVPGHELQATGLHEGWGGVATMARVAARLGVSTELCSPVGDDEASERLLRSLRLEGIGTTHCEHYTNWQLPTTVALATSADRAMVTVEHPPAKPVGHSLTNVDTDAIVIDLRDSTLPWLVDARRRGARVFASRGFDETGLWGDEQLAGIEGADVWMLNDLEARAFTQLSDPMDAARQLTCRVPTVVVTRGADGMVAVDAATGQEASVAAFPVRPRNTTGAGDATLAAFAVASGLTDALEEQLLVAAFVASTILAGESGAADPPRLAEVLQAARAHDDPRARRVAELLAQ